jgi:5-methylcytosine-specific restriction endonuclease McrBC regulatory subunit McrC
MKHVKADIVVKKDEKTFVLDTKWKMPKYDGKIVPSDADLHQMYVYLDIYGDVEKKNAQKVALLYPGQDMDMDVDVVEGTFVNTKAQCDMLFLPVKSNNISNDGKTEFRDWQGAIAERIMKWMGLN